ncbi:MAG TPA: hypothetical protein VFA54_04180 [Bryobacterales bacterium]|nr:hypothetical protein [Bryobacterales bacterium]
MAKIDGEQDAHRAPEHPGQADAVLYCPVCSTRLAERQCKLICEQCGYYLSCSDYY